MNKPGGKRESFSRVTTFCPQPRWTPVPEWVPHEQDTGDGSERNSQNGPGLLLRAPDGPRCDSRPRVLAGAQGPPRSARDREAEQNGKE